MLRVNLENIARRKYLIVILVAVLLSAFCVIRLVAPNHSYCYEGERILTPELGEMEDYVLYENISLPVGVYLVQLSYETDQDLQHVSTMMDSSVYSGALLTNYEHLYAGKNSTNYMMWLFESTHEMKACIGYSGSGNVTVHGITIVETDYLWSMLLTIIWSLALGCLGILYVRDYDKKIGLGIENKTVIMGLFAIVLIASMPYLLGASITGADFTYHLHRIEGVKDGLLSGQFPVRLEPEWLYGHGYANAIFYCNTFLMIPAVLRMLGFGVTASFNIFAVITNVATVGISYYCFSKIFKDKYIGLICSGLYTLSIFRIYKFTITSAIGEGTAVTFMPLVLYGLYRVFTEDAKTKEYKTAWIPIALGYAGLIQCHVLSCEITVLLTIIICLVCIKKILVWNTFWELAKGAGVALAMSAWYLVPFLDYYITEDVHIKHVSERTIQERGLNLAQLIFHYWELGNNALGGDKGMRGSHALGVGFVLFMAFCAVALLWYTGRIEKLPQNLKVLSKCGCGFALLLMLMSLNVFPWDRIQRMNGLTATLVSSLQFPNRFLGWGTVFLVLLAGCILFYCKNAGKRRMFSVGICIAVIGIFSSSVLLIDCLNRDHQRLYLYNDEGFGSGYISGAEYLIEGTEEEVLTYSSYRASSQVQVSEYEKGSLKASAYCVNETGEAGYVEFPLLHYKGYGAYAGEMELDCLKGENNVVHVMIPPDFDGRIEVSFVSPVYWRFAEATTYVCWMLFLGYFGRKYVLKVRKKC